MRPLSDSEPKVSWRLNDLLRAGQKAQAFAAVSWSNSDEDTHAPFTHWQPSSIANTESDGEVGTGDDVIKEDDIQLLEDPIASEEQLNNALKKKDKNIYPTLRLIISAIKDAEIAIRTKEKKELSDGDIRLILKKMVKQRNESCEVYKKAGRTELLDSEIREIEVINNFLPKQLNDDETKKICAEVVKSVGAASMKDMGKVMNELKSKYSDTLDFSKVSPIIRELLK